jgi:uncharacterized protein
LCGLFECVGEIGLRHPSKVALSGTPVVRQHVEMTDRENARVMRGVFEAIERRDDRRFNEYLDPECELHWPPSLPYGGSSRVSDPTHPTWQETWDPLQPTDVERAMDPRVVAAQGNEVVVLWQQRGLRPGGERLDTEVVGIYRLREGKLLRAQMFYFDTCAVARFLEHSVA